MGRDGRYDRSAFAHGLPPHLNHASSPLPLPSLLVNLLLSSSLTVKTLTGMTTDVYPRENCIAPDYAST